ncbi:DNA damage-inducible protein 1 [Loa loa]|uniref:DNA damage-inducible protein 1 n=1 Tax=Loa loa TaxID=7209 RepID=A0A1I7W296_LOALO|nr:DNA damage-inducible protein 1 [Loa loa]EJD75732.1 DNA damage-inducible protein 1 [Loa loa]
MKVTVACDLTGANVFPLEVNGDMEMENFLALCKFEISVLNDIPMSQLSIIHNGHTINVNASNLKTTLNDWKIYDNNIIVLVANVPTTSSKRPQYPNALVADLVKSIRVPQDSMRHDISDLKVNELAQLRVLFDELRNNVERRDRLRNVVPNLIAAVEKNDFDMFKMKYIAERESAFARERAMLDPTSAEGQRLIAEQIQRENIDFSHQFAMEHMPEAYIPVLMLYIKMKINGVEVKAFVDSGAQVSILSDSIAQRCNLMRLVDKRFQATVHGVGGAQQLLGKIHACQVQVEEQFFSCNFDVLANRDIDVLLGLDILKRHRCVIDLQNNCLRFGKSAVTHFLPDSEVPQRNLERVGTTNATNANAEVDSAKLASLMALGFEEGAARAMLIQCGNDVEAAAANLLARQSTL